MRKNNLEIITKSTKYLALLLSFSLILPATLYASEITEPEITTQTTPRVESHVNKCELEYVEPPVKRNREEAIEHIAQYTTHHSEAIVTNNYKNARLFQMSIDAAAVYVNASTRFTDGFEFGFGAEIGISTQKLHARGPMGLKELTSVKYLINGNGQIR